MSNNGSVQIKLLKCFSEDVYNLQCPEADQLLQENLHLICKVKRLRLWDQSAQPEAIAGLLDVGHRTFSVTALWSHQSHLD